jgi:hypothetical protein
MSKAQHCCYCGCWMSSAPRFRRGKRTVYAASMRTKDHILPKCIAPSSDWMPTANARHRNFYICCRACNELRARLGHCAGLLWIACGEAKRTRQTPGYVAEHVLRWGRAAVFGGMAV